MTVAGCSDEEEPGSSGRALYEEPFEDGNSFACATCHALTEPADDGLIRPGHPIGDAARRPSYKNGALTELLDAVNSCRVEWMGAPPFSADDARFAALEAFLGGETSGEADPIEYQIVEPPADLGGGDMEAGRALFNGRCAVCHGPDATGTVRGPPLVGERLDAETVGRRVRTSGEADSDVYAGLTGGRMPFWAADRLSDSELRDITAFVLVNDPTSTSPDGGVSDGGSLARDCDATHPKVGQTATLSTFAHDVSGTATIVDDCTIEVRMFDFDGGGIEVRFYGGLNGNYEGGFSMSQNLRGRGAYRDATVYAHVPEGRTLDDLDGISVWCVPARVSFGDGQFR